MTTTLADLPKVRAIQDGEALVVLPNGTLTIMHTRALKSGETLVDKPGVGLAIVASPRIREAPLPDGARVVIQDREIVSVECT